MSRYIDVEELKHITNNSSYYGTPELRAFLDMVADTPTADVREVVRGEWITCEDIGRKYRFCSACRSYSAYKTDFCPNCGADMGGKKNAE